MDRKATITQAAQDQNGRMYFRVGSSDPEAWISANDLRGNANAAFARLESRGINIVANKSRERVRQEAESIIDFEHLDFADCPGWIGKAYDFPDGETYCPRRQCSQVKVVFEPDRRYSPSGQSLRAWQDALGPLIQGQMIPLFALGYALVGPMLRFIPSDFTNPIVEFVGPAECGKSTMGALAASVWGGDPRNARGCADTWNFSPEAIDHLKTSHNDLLLVLDETNLRKKSPSKAALAEAVREAIFRLEDQSQRIRHGEPVDTSSSRLAVLSTSNVTLQSLVAGADFEEALLSRVVSIDLHGRRFGVLDHVPPGYASAREVVQALQRVIAVHFGIVARSFVDRLVKRQDLPFTPLLISLQLKRSLRELQGIGGARHEKSLALAMVALSLAQDFGIFPRAWGNARDVVLSVASLLQDREGGNREAVERMSAYIAENSKRFIRKVDPRCRLSPIEYKAKAGFWLGEQKVLVPTCQLQAGLSTHRADMVCLRSLGIAKTEGGNQPKLSIKAPQNITDEGRGYCIDLAALEAYRKAQSAR